MSYLLEMVRELRNEVYRHGGANDFNDSAIVDAIDVMVVEIVAAGRRLTEAESEIRKMKSTLDEDREVLK